MLVLEKRWEALGIPAMCDGFGIGVWRGVTFIFYAG
jgi:hypothetical protein